jgi:pantoate--beta-alanine ligase
MMLETVRSPSEMRRKSTEWKSAGLRVVFVPTMGFLHAGHLSLLQSGRKRGDVLVLSIFVNPTQFGPKEDLSRYPRDLEGDLAKASQAGVDVVFLPEPADMYPEGYQTYVEVRELEQGLCGDRRPGHFRGVATVVLKLFNLVQPQVALFGEKDYQQLQVIKRLARDLDIPVEIVGGPTARAEDGLALSSRNAYLTPAERLVAGRLNVVLADAARRLRAGDTVAAVEADARAALDAAGFQKIDYVEARGAEDLARLGPGPVAEPARILAAAFLGRTRLIDNMAV